MLGGRILGLLLIVGIRKRGRGTGRRGGARSDFSSLFSFSFSFPFLVLFPWSLFVEDIGYGLRDGLRYGYGHCIMILLAFIEIPIIHKHDLNRTYRLTCT